MNDFPQSPEEFVQLLEGFEKGGGKVSELPQELQELVRNFKRAKSGGGPLPDDVGTEEITPDPVFVVKTSDDTGRKIFVNMCASPKVAAPGNWANGKMPEEVTQALADQDNMTDAQSEMLRFPISLSQPRVDMDKKGEPCTVYDCVFNTDVIKQAQAMHQLKVFIIQLALNWISHKSKTTVSEKFKLPKMKCKGGAPEPMRIRVDKKPLVSEICDVPDEPSFPLVTKPVVQKKTENASKDSTNTVNRSTAHASTKTVMQKQDSANDSGPGGISGKVGVATGSGANDGVNFSFGQPSLPELQYTLQYDGRPVKSVQLLVTVPPGVVDVSKLGPEDVGVQVGVFDVKFTVAGCAPMTVDLPLSVDGRASTARFEEGALQVCMPYLPLDKVIEEMQAMKPHASGQVKFVNQSYLELE